MEAEGKVGTWKELSPLSAPPSLVGQGEGKRENMAGGLRGGDPHSSVKDINYINLETKYDFLCNVHATLMPNLNTTVHHWSESNCRGFLVEAERSGRRQ